MSFVFNPRTVRCSSPIFRATRDGLLRNACVVLGNIGDVKAVPALTSTLAHDPSPVVRGHAAWALGELNADQALRARQSVERDPDVLIELSHALDVCRASP